MVMMMKNRKGQFIIHEACLLQQIAGQSVTISQCLPTPRGTFSRNVSCNFLGANYMGSMVGVSGMNLI